MLRISLLMRKTPSVHGPRQRKGPMRVHILRHVAPGLAGHPQETGTVPSPGFSCSGEEG